MTKTASSGNRAWNQRLADTDVSGHEFAHSRSGSLIRDTPNATSSSRMMSTLSLRLAALSSPSM